MSKSGKAKHVTHYTPYQVNANENDALVDFDDELDLEMDPVLTGFSSHFDRNLWADWNEVETSLELPDDFAAFVEEEDVPGKTIEDDGHTAGTDSLSPQSDTNPTTYDSFPAPTTDSTPTIESEDVDMEATQEAVKDEPRIDRKRSLSEDLANILSANQNFEMNQMPPQQQQKTSFDDDSSLNWLNDLPANKSASLLSATKDGSAALYGENPQSNPNKVQRHTSNDSLDSTGNATDTASTGSNCSMQNNSTPSSAANLMPPYNNMMPNMMMYPMAMNAPNTSDVNQLQQQIQQLQQMQQMQMSMQFNPQLAMQMMQQPWSMSPFNMQQQQMQLQWQLQQLQNVNQMQSSAPTSSNPTPSNSTFVNIARKPEEPPVSSMLQSLMQEEAKKKEKKLERNRDSARESRRKQQTYVETLETGIKRLQINKDLVQRYQWGVTGPGFGPLPCPQSPQMFEWRQRLDVVTGKEEHFSNLQNPAGFKGLMAAERQRRALSVSSTPKQLIVWKSMVAIGKHLAHLRTQVLAAQALQSVVERDNAALDGNSLTAELSNVLQLSAEQKIQLQCAASRIVSVEYWKLVALVKVFRSLRRQAQRLAMIAPSLESFLDQTASADQMQKLLQWSVSHRNAVYGLTFA